MREEDLIPLSAVLADPIITGYFITPDGRDFYSNRQTGLKKLMVYNNQFQCPYPSGTQRRSFKVSDIQRCLKSYLAKAPAKAIAVPAPSLAQILQGSILVNKTSTFPQAPAQPRGVSIKGKWFIGSVNDAGEMSFAPQPKKHNSEAEVDAEILRLATVNPGKKFIKCFVAGAVTVGTALWD